MQRGNRSIGKQHSRQLFAGTFDTADQNLLPNISLMKYKVSRCLDPLSIVYLKFGNSRRNQSTRQHTLISITWINNYVSMEILRDRPYPQ